jgi:ABC-type nitrate/sulfonate/bicarbonate transport system permease component
MRRLSGFVLVGALLALWEASARLGWVVSDNWPPLSVVLHAGLAEAATGELPARLLGTLWRALAGFALGSLLGVAVGFALAGSRLAARTLGPLIELLRPIPVPAIIPPLILFLGIDDGMKLAVIALAAFFPAALATAEGARGVDATLRDLARTFRLPRANVFAAVLLPAALPFIMAGLRIGLALALVVAVVAEMIAGDAGLGHHLVLMQFAVRAPEMYATILLLAASGYALNRAFLAVERRVLFWHHAAGRAAVTP